MIRVGTNQLSYNQIRNFAGLPFRDISFTKAMDVYKIPAYIKFRLLNKVDYNLVFRFNDLGLNRNIHLFHFFNAITPVKKPWVVTYETKLPRPDADFKKGYAWLAGKYCKKIIAYTNRAWHAQQHQMEKYPEFKEAILSKITVLHPSQKLIVTETDSRSYNEELHFVFAGSAFYRKGGYELVKAFDLCRKRNLPVRLSIVSKMETEGYCDKNIKPEIEAETKKLIDGNPLITYYNGLPNEAVMQLLLQAHVGILPSYGETFGYFLLEAMACGCTVVATSVSPFTEFVNGNVGYLIPVPTEMRDVEYIDIDNPAKFRDISNHLVGAIFDTVEGICNNRKLLEARAQQSIAHIRDHYSPLDRIAVLEKIYREALTA